MKNGKLSKREMATIESAWRILSRWTEWQEEHSENPEELFEKYDYDVAMSAVASLCDFVMLNGD